MFIWLSFFETMTFKWYVMLVLWSFLLIQHWNSKVDNAGEISFYCARVQ